MKSVLDSVQFEHQNDERTTKTLPELGAGVSVKDLVYEGKSKGFVTFAKLFSGNRAPEEPRRRPKFIRVVTAPAPENVKTAAGLFTLPALSIFSGGANFLYNDNKTKELRMNCFVVGQNGIGKGSVKPMLDAILSSILEKDKEGWATHKEYNSGKVAAGETKTEKRPEVKIRIIPADITMPELNQIGEESEGKPLFMHVLEPEELDTLKGGLRGRKHFAVMKKADDEDNTAGQLRAGAKSVSAKYNLRLNYVIEIRPTQLLQFFSSEIINGARDRASFCEIQSLEDKHQWPKMGDTGEKYIQTLLPYIENIQAAKGTIVCLRANKLIDKIREEFLEYFDETQDEVLEIITHRALCRAFKRACLIYIAERKKWDPALNTWIRWSFLYDMWMHFHYFYDAIKGKNSKLETTKRGPDPILDMLGEEFNFEQLKQVYIKLGKEPDVILIQGAIRQWVRREKIERTETGFRKILK